MTEYGLHDRLDGVALTWRGHRWTVREDRPRGLAVVVGISAVVALGMGMAVAAKPDCSSHTRKARFRFALPPDTSHGIAPTTRSTLSFDHVGLT